MTSANPLHFGDRDLSALDLLSILEGVADGITAQDPEGRLIYANPAAARALGYPTPQDLIMAPPTEILSRFQMFGEDGALQAPDQLPGQRALHGEAEAERVLRYRDVQTGEERWSAVRAQPVFDANGQVRFVINNWHDVTSLIEQQRTADETSGRLEEMAAELEATIEDLNARTELAEIRADRQRFLAEAGRLLAASLDYEETLRMIVHLAVPRVADWAVVSLVDHNGMLRQLEVAHANPDKLRAALELQRRYPPDPTEDAGQYRVLRTGKSEFYPVIPSTILEKSARDDDHLRLLRELDLHSAMVVPMHVQGKSLGVITLIRAESQRAYHEEDLEFAESLAARAALAVSNAQLYRDASEANRVKSDFLAIMSHELRTPLTAIFGYTELLATGVTGPISESQATYLDRIHSSASHLLTIIEDILNYARAEAGKDQVVSNKFTLVEVVTEAVNMLAPAAEKKQLSIIPEIRQDANVVSDRAKIRQVLLNLLGNAVKFTDAGHVAIRATGLPDGWFMFEVEDTGPGIAEADRERIFEPFQQLQPSMTRTAGGTGLGLAVTRRFVDLLGGSVEVGTPPSGGTIFTVRIPSNPL